MSTVVKDLGAVSAYAYAVEKGYTGTEAEFAELMADYAEVGQRAEDAADSALESKTAAQTAATTATNKASEATTAATTATTKAGEASTSANTATSAKDTAVSASQTATSKASEAAQSATSANTAKVDAVAAKTAAETAQGKAEDAQAAAEAVAESIPSDYSQLSEDVSDLKENLSYQAIGQKTISNSDLEQGSYNGSGGTTTNATRIRTKGFISVKKGERLSFTGGTNAKSIFVGYFTVSGVFIRDGSWKSDSYLEQFDDDYNIILVFRKEDSSASLSPTEYDATTYIIKKWVVHDDDIISSLDSLSSELSGLPHTFLDATYTLENGYMSETGAIYSESLYKHASIECVGGERYKITTREYNSSVAPVVLFDVNGTGTILVHGTTELIDGVIITVPSNAKKIVVNVFNNYINVLNIQKRTYSIDRTKYITLSDTIVSGALQTSAMVTISDLGGIANSEKIRCVPNERIEIIMPNINGITYHYRYGFYDSSGGFISQIVNTEYRTVTIPNDCYYFSFGVFQYEDGAYKTNPTLYSNIINSGVTVAYLDRNFDVFINEDQVLSNIETFAESSDNLATIEDKLIQAKRPLNLSNNAYLSEPQPLVLLHFSDIHGDETELARMVNLKKKYASKIHDAICTGDIVTDRYSNGIEFWTNTIGSENILMAIGNHDVLTASSGYDWSQRATQAEQYSRYFSPFISNWGVTYNSGETYYYKDYTSQNIRLIVVNCMLQGDDDTNQLTWFANALAGAKTNNYSVVVASHYMIANPERIGCNFSCIDKNAGGDVLSINYSDAVQSFIAGGGDFICYIAGHTHWDLIVKSTTYPNQICVVIDALSRAQCNNYSDVQRVDGTKSQDLANIIVFDTSSNAIKIIRYGANIDHYLRPKNCISINYKTGEIITQW